MSNLDDHQPRLLAVDPQRTVLVQAPAGSGKTTLLTERFLALLARVNDPGEIVAITFTNAAAAEMKNRILEELEKAERESNGNPITGRPATELAKQAYRHAEVMEWKLLDQPAQLRITTIDSFCRQLALQQPLLSGLGGQLNVDESPGRLYLEAARRTLQKLSDGDNELRDALRALLEWRDNNWSALEEELVRMLGVRDKWFQPFLFDADIPEDELRSYLEKPFRAAVHAHLELLNELVDAHPALFEQALVCARFADSNQEESPFEKLWLLEGPHHLNEEPEAMAELLQAYCELASFLLTTKDAFRKSVTVKDGFPPAYKNEKLKFTTLLKQLDTVEGLQAALAGARHLPTPRYTEVEWRTIHACFTVLRRAYVELKVVFAETGRVDFSEVAKLAQSVFSNEAGEAAEAAFTVAEGIRHLLVDEFQDTNRIQYRLLGSIIDVWPELEGRSAFVVGDPMQSIYFFRNAEAELFHRTRENGLDLPSGGVQRFEPASLTSNFRTQHELVGRLNGIFGQLAAVNGEDHFVEAQAARNEKPLFKGDGFHLHLGYMAEKPRSRSNDAAKDNAADEQQDLHVQQIDEIVKLCQSYALLIEKAKAEGSKFRIAVLGRTKKALTPIAAALRDAGINYRALDLEPLTGRAEVLDALALARALLNPEDRINWLGVLRAPWCGLALEDIHQLVSADDDKLQKIAVPQLVSERMQLLPEAAQQRLRRMLDAYEFAHDFKAQNPSATLGTWLETVWLKLGGAHCVTAAERVNLDLLWRALDKLNNSEADLLGPALETALESLQAQPDPASSTHYGVQLMTIHKAKGLEFEVVIVPELQSPVKQGNDDMLSWLERGTTEQDEAPTEFLVAARQPKGGDRSSNKAWVDTVIRQRERDEMARLLYVACTRAREELHLFARLRYRGAGTEMEIQSPLESLLKTVYPALQAEIDADFDRWKSERIARTKKSAEPVDVAIAAAADVVSINHRKPTVQVRLRRLDLDRLPETTAGISSAQSAVPVRAELYQRQRGGFESRLLGRTIHTLLEAVTNARAAAEWPEALKVLSKQRPQLIAGMRAQGCSVAEANALLLKAESAVQTAVESQIGRWILAPHPFAASESKWTGVIGRELRQLRPDRLFQAGDAPLADVQSSQGPEWWIIDYKSAHLAKQFTGQELAELRRLYAPQLELYGRFLRELEGEEFAINLGLFYPAAAQFDHWKINFS